MEQEGQKRRARMDVIIFLIITILAIAFYYVHKSSIISFSTDNNYNVLVRTGVLGLLHFCLAGLAVVLIMIFRKEKLRDIGISTDGLLETFKYCALLAVIFISITVLRGTWRLVYPFRQAWISDDLLLAPIPVMLIGLAFCAVCCGMFEGLSYAYLSRKINMGWPTKNVFLSPGPIIIALIGFAAHALLGLNGWQHSIQTLFLIYGMLIIYEKTKNIVGCAVIFGLMWNML